MKRSNYRDATGAVVFLLLVTGSIGCETIDPRSVMDPTPPDATTNTWQRLITNANGKAASIPIHYLGFIDVTQDREGESQYFEAGFARFDKPVELSLIVNNFQQPAADSCSFHEKAPGDSSPLEFPDEFEFPGHQLEFVGAGETIEVAIGNRRYARLERESADSLDQVQYETDVGSLPISFGGHKFGDILLKTSGMRASASGDVFPAFSNVAVPPVDSVKSFKPGHLEWIEPDTRLRWRKGKYGDDPSVRVQIEAGGGGRALFCAVTDDGEFELPPEIAARMKGRAIPNLEAYRDVIWFHHHADAVLVVSQSSYY